jgi:hypothetical protein
MQCAHRGAREIDRIAESLHAGRRDRDACDAARWSCERRCTGRQATATAVSTGQCGVGVELPRCCSRTTLTHPSYCEHQGRRAVSQCKTPCAVCFVFDGVLADAHRHTLKKTNIEANPAGKSWQKVSSCAGVCGGWLWKVERSSCSVLVPLDDLQTATRDAFSGSRVHWAACWAETQTG